MPLMTVKKTKETSLPIKCPGKYVILRFLWAESPTGQWSRLATQPHIQRIRVSNVRIKFSNIALSFLKSRQVFSTNIAF